MTPLIDVSFLNDHDPPRNFVFSSCFQSCHAVTKVILVDFGEVAVEVSPGLKSGIGFYVRIGVGVRHQVPVPTVLQDLQILPKQDPRGEESRGKKPSCMCNSP